MPNASDTFRLGLDADDVAAPPMAVALIRARDVVVGDAITELDSPDGPWYEVLAVEADGFTVDGQDYDGGCEGHEATTAGRYNGPIGETITCDGSCLRPLPVPLEVASTDQVLVRRPVNAGGTGADPAGIDPALVTVSETERFGFYRPEPNRFESEPVVAIAQAIARPGGRMEWHPTPGRYYERTVLGMNGDVDLSIDHGQGWSMPAADVRALKRFCFAGRRPLIEQGPLVAATPPAAPLTPRVLADGLSALIATVAGDLEAADVAALDAAFRVCTRLA